LKEGIGNIKSIYQVPRSSASFILGDVSFWQA